MKSGYRDIGDFIELVDERNRHLSIDLLLGLTINKEFIPSVANVVGADMANYKIIRKGQFACSIMQVRRDKKMPIALLEDHDVAIISQAYPVFKIKDETELLPQYLMMWFSRREFDREACFYAVGGVRGSLEWEDFLQMQLPVPSPEKQREIVAEYNTIINRIRLNEQLNQKLEETAQALYKHWFVDFEFPDEKGNPYKSSGGKMIWNEELEKEVPEGWETTSFGDLVELEMGQSPKGESYNYEGFGTPLVNGPVEFGRYFTSKRKWTTAPTKLSKKGDLIVCVRGSTTGRFVKSDGVYCLGRGVCSIRSFNQAFVDLLFKSNIQELLGLTTGSTFPNWDRDTLSSFQVLKPSKNIIDLFCKITRNIILLVEDGFFEIECLSELNQLILSKMTKVEVEEKEVV